MGQLAVEEEAGPVEGGQCACDTPADPFRRDHPCAARREIPGPAAPRSDPALGLAEESVETPAG